MRTKIFTNVTACQYQGPRDYQQDRFYISENLIAIADGMGGHERGDEAAEAAMNALWKDEPPVTVREMEAMLEDCGRAVLKLGDGHYRDPGSTIVAASFSTAGHLLLGWCGDSRAYIISSIHGWVEQLTTDHAFVGGGLERCLGANMQTLPEVLIVSNYTTDDDLILLTDGAYERLMIDQDFMGTADQILDTAHAYILRDNATAVVATLGDKEDGSI